MKSTPLSRTAKRNKSNFFKKIMLKLYPKYARHQERSLVLYVYLVYLVILSSLYVLIVLYLYSFLKINYKSMHFFLGGGGGEVLSLL
jgi:hypothetical protein